MKLRKEVYFYLDMVNSGELRLKCLVSPPYFLKQFLCSHLEVNWVKVQNTVHHMLKNTSRVPDEHD